MKSPHPLILLGLGIITSLLLSLGVLASLFASSVQGAPRLGTGVPARSVPVVATWFTDLHPRVGQQETVEVQVWSGRRYLAEARLSVILRVGTRTLGHRPGTRTNRQGKALARFRVPRQARGKWLWAFTSLSYRHRVLTGNNRVLVAK
jgi:hypothetical protein